MNKTTVSEVEAAISLELIEKYGDFPCFHDKKKCIKQLTILYYTRKVKRAFKKYMHENLPSEIADEILNEYKKGFIFKY